MKPAAVVSTYPTRAAASKAARAAVRLRLAACVNIAEISSVYAWKGRIEDGPEYMALFKTTHRRKKELKEHIRKSHPYDVPEIAELEMPAANSPYMRWIAESTS